MSFKLRDVVMVIVDRPDGCMESTYTFGEVGVISEIENVAGRYDYTVHNMYGDYIYGDDQIRLLTDEECRVYLQIFLTDKEAKGMTRINKAFAYDRAGYRERYAMENGNKETKKQNGHTLWVFTYSESDPYQDANGATYDTTEGRWIG